MSTAEASTEHRAPVLAVDAAGARALRDRILRVLGPALVTVAFVEVLRIWLPSLVFVVEEGRFSPGTLLTLGTGLGVVTSVVVVVAIGRTHARQVLAVGVILLAIARLLLAIGPIGGTRQVVISSVGAVGGLMALLAIAADGRAPREDRLAIGMGLLGASLLHAATGTLGLIWPQTTTTAFLGAGIAAGGVLGALHWLRDRRARADRDPLPAASAAWTWWMLLPVLLLVLSLSGVPGRLSVATGWDTVTNAVGVAILHVLAALAVLLPWRWPRIRAIGLVVVGLPLGTAAVLQGTGWSAVVGAGLIAISAGLLLGVPEPSTTGAAPRTRAVVAGSALVLALVLGSATALATQLSLPTDRRTTAISAALVGALLAWRLVREPRAVPQAGQRSLALVLAGAALAASAVGATALVAASLPATPSLPRLTDPTAAPTLRVGLYNIRHGFDLEGRFAAAEQAELLASLDLDVLVLNDVDRGWLSTGGHDALGVIERRLGLTHTVFGASTDTIHGNAVLTRLPLLESATDRLPAGADPQPRGQVAVVVEWPRDGRLGIVGTHLAEGPDRTDTRIPQARAVAGTVGLLRERQVPTVLLGDLGAGPGTTELNSFGTLLEDALPDGIATFPADNPVEHLDHVLVSPELRRLSVELPAVPRSDHLPIVVTLELPTQP